MILKSLKIDRKHPWDTKTPLVGEIEFENASGEIKLRLTEAMSGRILAIVADGLVEAAQEVAQHLTRAIVVPTLTHDAEVIEVPAIEAAPAEVATADSDDGVPW